MYQKMSESHNVGSVTPTSRLKDSRAKKLGVLPRTLWSNDQDPALLVKAYRNAPITTSRVHYTNVTCEGLTCQEARRASPNSLVERQRSGITFYFRESPKCIGRVCFYFEVPLKTLQSNYFGKMPGGANQESLEEVFAK